MSTKISQEVAIRRFKSAWRDWKERYDYSDVIYKNQNTLIKIKCLKHNQFFLQKPCDHWLGKNGCSDCKKDSKRALYCSNKDDFVKRANDTHKDSYNYSKVVYYNARTNVTITCPFHGDFIQTPDSHVRGSGCPSCGYERGASKNALPFEEFEKKANKVHLKKFKYHKESYFSTSRKTKIKCPRHGVFFTISRLSFKGSWMQKMCRRNLY